VRRASSGGPQLIIILSGCPTPPGQPSAQPAGQPAAFSPAAVPASAQRAAACPTATQPALLAADQPAAAFCTAVHPGWSAKKHRCANLRQNEVSAGGCVPEARPGFARLRGTG